MTEWDSLDNAAKANLTNSQVQSFMVYKDQLKTDNHAWKDDAEDILVGYI